MNVPTTGIDLFGVCDFAARHDGAAVERCAALLDTGKCLTADPYADIALTTPYVVNWQIKETLGSSMKTPRTDMKKVVAIIREAG